MKTPSELAGPPPSRFGARWRPAFTLALFLSGCQLAGQVQNVPAESELSPSPVAEAGLGAVPACQAAGTATLAGGMRVSFDGASPEDPLACQVSWSGRTYRFLAGFWGAGRYKGGPAEERHAVSQVVAGPVGAKASFDDVKAGLWGEVTAEHVANPVLDLKSGKRRTVLVRMVEHDDQGREAVRSETLNWIDAKSGVTLKRDVVIRLGDGTQNTETIWEVERLDGVAS
jgi:hypothetical protein